MIVYGTTVNIVAAFLGFALFAGDAPTALAVTVYFAPLPYNVFTVAALWRSARRLEEPLASTARVIGLVWLVVATAV